MICRLRNSLMYGDVGFFFNATATTDIYTLSLHDALPIFLASPFLRIMGQLVLLLFVAVWVALVYWTYTDAGRRGASSIRSEEHTSELQSRQYLVCRLLLEKKRKQQALLITTFGASHVCTL